MSELIKTYQAVIDATQIQYATLDDLVPFADKIKAFLLAKHTVFMKTIAALCRTDISYVSRGSRAYTHIALYS